MDRQTATRKPGFWVICILLLSASVCQAKSHEPPDFLEHSSSSLATNSVITQGKLEPDKPIERPLPASESHSYSLTLLADQFLKVVVEQRGVDVMITLLAPDGKKLSEVNRVKGPQGFETVIFIAEAAGEFRLEVRQAEKNSPAGNYSIKLNTLRTPTAEERELVNAQRLTEQASNLRQNGKYDEALSVAERALAVREKLLGPEDPGVADSLNLLALIYDDKGDYVKAEPLNLRALAIREKALGADHPDVARSLFNLAWIYKVRQEFAKAESAYRRVLAIQEKALGPNHTEVATTLNDLAVLYNQTGNHDESIRVNERVLAIRERALGPEDSGVAKALNNLARAYERKGDYEQAESQLKRAVAIWVKALGEDHPEVAFGLDGLAKIYVYKGDYAAAEPLFLRALAIREKALGPQHTEVATTLNNLAVLYRQKGDYAKAEPLLLRDLAITEKNLGPNHRFVAPTLNNLAGIYMLQGDYLRAEPLYQRALTIYEKSLGAQHQDVGLTLSLLGQLYAARRGEGDDQRADTLFKRSLTTLEKALGPEHPMLATPLIGFGELSARKMDWQQAENFYQRSLAIQEKTLGAHHPDVAQSLDRLARLYRASGQIDKAVKSLSRSQEIRERQLNHNLPVGSERQKVEYLRLFAQDTDLALSLHANSAPQNPQALSLAFTTLLRRKGRALDVMSDNIATLRRRAAPQDQALFDELADIRSQLATLTLRGPSTANPSAYRAQLTRLEDKLDKLEAEASVRSIEFRIQSQPITLESVQSAIPAGTLLVELAICRGDDGTSRYSAYLLPDQGSPKWFDLGPARAIDQLVDAWRVALRDPRRRDVRQLARTIDSKIMQPLRSVLGTARHLLLSPDGPLNLIPFAALVDEQKRFLMERYTITYVTSGRDLLRLRTSTKSSMTSVIVADPAFGEPALVAADPARSSTKRIDYSQVFFGPLPGVSEEVRALRQLLPDATFLVKDQATEAAVKKLHGPRILHVATHGFFLQEGDQSSATNTNDNVRLGKWAARVDNPLLRSGLALAGANQGRYGDDDGVLTALEAGGLDLWGTRLVVLSACDTGVGEVKTGDGVYGLRRALVLAGSESQMMSLWPVSDSSTHELMVGFYQELTQGRGRGESLRQSQLKMIRKPGRAHPYYWASFIQSGEWANLEGQR